MSVQTSMDADLLALSAIPGPFGLNYFVVAYAESDTRALVNALWVVQHAPELDLDARKTMCLEFLGFYSTRFEKMYALSNLSQAADDVCRVVADAGSADELSARLGPFVARLGEMNYAIDALLPPDALAQAFKAGKGS